MSGAEAVSATDVRPSAALASAALWRREVVRFARDRSRIVGALGTPIVFWLLLGSGIGRSFSVGGASTVTPTTSTTVAAPTDYLEYFFPGTLVLIVLFSAIFSTISVIEDRREGFLQGVLVAPVGRSSIVLGKILGSTTLALIQAMLFLVLAPLAGLSLTAGTVASVGLVLLIVSIGLSGLGFVVAWPMDSTQGFHAIMNLFLIPMWMLSGALFPVGGASGWIAWLMRVNPLTYGVDAVRHAFYPGGAVDRSAVASPPIAVAVTIAFAALMVVASMIVVARRR